MSFVLFIVLGVKVEKNLILELGNSSVSPYLVDVKGENVAARGLELKGGE